MSHNKLYKLTISCDYSKDNGRKSVSKEMGELAGRVDLGWERRTKSHRANTFVETWGTELRIMKNHDKLRKRWVLNDITTVFLEQMIMANILKSRQEMLAKPARPIKEIKVSPQLCITHELIFSGIRKKWTNLYHIKFNF